MNDYSDYMWGRFFNKESELSDNVVPILKKLFQQGKEVKYIRCDNQVKPNTGTEVHRVRITRHI